MNRIHLIIKGKHCRLIRGGQNMDEIYFGDGDNVHLQYQSGRDDVRIMVLGMIYVIYIAISRRIHEQPIKEIRIGV